MLSTGHSARLTASTLTLGTWNILATVYIRRSFYPNTPPHVLDAGRRVEALLARACELKVNILCLQEVERAVFDALQSGMAARGYRGTLALKGGGKPDGCAVFFETRVCSLLKEQRVGYDDGVDGSPNSGHIAQCLTLEIAGARLALVNTHLKWDPPDTPKERQWGYRQVSQALRLVAEDASDAQVICGDFNATPGADAVELLLAAGFDYTHRAGDGTFTCNSNRVPKLIDYIAIRGFREAEPVPVSIIDSQTPLPSDEHPSDHLPLSARVTL